MRGQRLPARSCSCFYTTTIIENGNDDDDDDESQSSSFSRLFIDPSSQLNDKWHTMTTDVDVKRVRILRYFLDPGDDSLRVAETRSFEAQL